MAAGDMCYHKGRMSCSLRDGTHAWSSAPEARAHDAHCHRFHNGTVAMPRRLPAREDNRTSASAADEAGPPLKSPPATSASMSRSEPFQRAGS